MEVYRDIEQLPAFKNAVITIGTFDGVHAGHRKIIDSLEREAEKINGESVIITFYDHRFGRDRQGDYRLLEKMAPIYGYNIGEIPKQVLDEIAISSTNI